MQSERTNKRNVSCDEIRPLLGTYADGELDTEQVRLVRQHLRVCHSCRQELAQIQRMTTVVKKTTVPPPEEPGFFANLRKAMRREIRGRVRGEARREQKARSLLGWRPRLAATLVVSLAVGVAILSVEIWRSGSGTPGARSRETSPAIAPEQRTGGESALTATAPKQTGTRAGNSAAVPRGVAGGVNALAPREETAPALEVPQATRLESTLPGSAENQGGVSRRLGGFFPSPTALRKGVAGDEATGSLGNEKKPPAPRRPAKIPVRAISPVVIGPPARYPAGSAALDSLRRRCANRRVSSDPVSLVAWGLVSRDTVSQRLACQGVLELSQGLRWTTKPDAKARLLEVVERHREVLIHYLGRERLKALEQRLLSARPAKPEAP